MDSQCWRMAAALRILLPKPRSVLPGIPIQDTIHFRQPHKEAVLHPAHMDDRLLWHAFREGDEKALVQIFDRYADPLYNYGCKITCRDDMVKDAVQELFIVIWKQRNRLGDTDCIKSYLFKSLRRKLVRSLSRIQHRFFSRLSASNDYIGEVIPSHELSIISQQDSEDKRLLVMQMMSTLTRRQQEVLFLRYFEEMSCEEIAVVMELSKQAVYNLIHKALRELRSAFNAPNR